MEQFSERTQNWIMNKIMLAYMASVKHDDLRIRQHMMASIGQYNYGR